MGTKLDQLSALSDVFSSNKRLKSLKTGYRNREFNGIRFPVSRSTSVITSTANKECPPKSKKSLSGLISFTPKTVLHTLAISFSSDVIDRESTISELDATIYGFGNLFLSTLLLAVKGYSFKISQSLGTI